jgi:hypothetical protein
MPGWFRNIDTSKEDIHIPDAQRSGARTLRSRYKRLSTQKENAPPGNPVRGVFKFRDVSNRRALDSPPKPCRRGLAQDRKKPSDLR